MRKLIVIAGALALGACQGPAKPADQAESAAPTPADVEVVPPSETAIVASESGTVAVAPGAIPSGLQGRWGLVPDDCTSTRGDAKGLLVVAGDKLTFFESRARLDKPGKATADSVTGEFAFTGEGQSWRKTVTLRLDKGALVRTEDDLPQPLRYQRCPAPAGDAPADSAKRGS